MIKTLSIVTVTWNCKAYVKEFLDSLHPLRAKDVVEVIVVDNASSDGTVEFVRQHYPDVIVIQSSENLGFSRGNNLGIGHTSGRYICLINPDVRVLDGCIEEMLQYLESNTDVGLLGPKMLDGDSRPARSYMGAPTLWRMFCRALALDVLFPRSRIFAGFLMHYFDHNCIADVDILNGWFWITRREALQQVGPLDESLFMYADDLDWSKRFLDAGWRLVYFPAVASIHYGAGASRNAPLRFSVEMQRSNYQYWKKNHGCVSQLVYLAIISLHQILRLIGYSIVLPFRISDRSDILRKIRRSLACLQWVLKMNKANQDRPPVISELS